MKITATIPQSVVDALLAGHDLALEVAMIAQASPGIDPQPPLAGPAVFHPGRQEPPLEPPRTLEAQGARRISAPGTRHLYSRQAALSDDGALALVMQRDGHFLIVESDGGEGITVAPNTGLAGGNCDANWTGDLTIYAVGNDGALRGANVLGPDGDSLQWFRIEGLAPGERFAHSGAEGRPSRVQRFPFMLHDANFRVTRSVVTDHNGAILLWVPNNGDNPNHVTVSPSGRYFIVSRAGSGSNAGGDPTRHAGTWAYDLFGGPVVQIANGSQHSDVCTGKDGRDYFIYADFDATSDLAGKVWYCPIENPADRTVVLDTYGPNHDVQNNAFHFSGCGPDGWVLASAYGTAPRADRRVAWWDHRIFAIELGGERRVALLADHNSAYIDDYWQEPHACWSRNGRRIIFASNNRGAHEPASYVLDVPVLP